MFFFVFFGIVFIFLLLLVNFLSDESGWRNGRVLYSLYPPEIPSFSVAFHVKSSFRGRPHVKTSSTTAATTTTTTNSENCNDHSKDIGYFISDWLRGPSFNFPAIWLFVLVNYFFSRKLMYLFIIRLLQIYDWNMVIYYERDSKAVKCQIFPIWRRWTDAAILLRSASSRFQILQLSVRVTGPILRRLPT